MAETEGERKCKTKRYPVKFLVETKSSLCGGVYDKGQDVEIKSIKLFSRKAAEVWGGVGMASNTVHVEGPLWVAAVVDNIHRGGAGFYDVYVPSSANAESCKMANILFKKVPRSCIRPRRTRTITKPPMARPSESNELYHVKMTHPKLVEQIRREKAKEASWLRQKVRRVEAKKSRERANKARRKLSRHNTHCSRTRRASSYQHYHHDANHHRGNHSRRQSARESVHKTESAGGYVNYGYDYEPSSQKRILNQLMQDLSLTSKGSDWCAGPGSHSGSRCMSWDQDPNFDRIATSRVVGTTRGLGDGYSGYSYRKKSESNKLRTIEHQDQFDANFQSARGFKMQPRVTGPKTSRRRLSAMGMASARGFGSPAIPPSASRSDSITHSYRGIPRHTCSPPRYIYNNEARSSVPHDENSSSPRSPRSPRTSMEALARGTTDWFDTWDRIEHLDDYSRSLVLVGDEAIQTKRSSSFTDGGNGKGFGRRVSRKTLEEIARQRSAILVLWEILRVPETICERNYARYITKSPSQDVYTDVTQQATWLRSCLVKLLKALRSIAAREKKAAHLQDVIAREIPLDPQPHPHPENDDPKEAISPKVGAAVEQLIMSDALCLSDIHSWLEVTPWVQAESFIYKGEMYFARINKDRRFLDSAFHALVKQRVRAHEQGEFERANKREQESEGREIDKADESDPGPTLSSRPASGGERDRGAHRQPVCNPAQIANQSSPTAIEGEDRQTNDSKETDQNPDLDGDLDRQDQDQDQHDQVQKNQVQQNQVQHDQDQQDQDQNDQVQQDQDQQDQDQHDQVQQNEGEQSEEVEKNQNHDRKQKKSQDHYSNGEHRGNDDEGDDQGDDDDDDDDDESDSDFENLILTGVS